jgi:hypothetical protein
MGLYELMHDKQEFNDTKSILKRDIIGINELYMIVKE